MFNLIFQSLFPPESEAVTVDLSGLETRRDSQQPLIVLLVPHRGATKLQVSVAITPSEPL